MVPGDGEAVRDNKRYFYILVIKKSFFYPCDCVDNYEILGQRHFCHLASNLIQLFNSFSCVQKHFFLVNLF